MLMYRSSHVVVLTLASAFRTVCTLKLGRILRLSMVAGLFVMTLHAQDENTSKRTEAEPAPPGIAQDQARKWKLMWRDEFDGTTLDLSKWAYRGLGRRESAIISQDCVSLDGHGLLHLWVKEQDGVLHNGMIGTQGKFDFRFGIAAGRIRFPRQQGQHGSLWMQPARSEKAVDDAARSGAEIDITEWFGAARRDSGVASNVYWPGQNGKRNRIGRMADVSSFIKAGVLMSDDFHVYSVEWSPGAYVFRIDGHEVLRTSEGISHQPEYLILSLLTSDWEAGRLDRTKLPNSMDVDWVRVWQSDAQPSADAKAAGESPAPSAENR
jgi:beta-glucanase (GH16 family)